MVGRSDIEEIEIDEDSNSLDNDDSASNLSEPTRQLRQRKTRQREDKAEQPSTSSAASSTRQKRQKKIIDKEREEFLSEFDRTNSERERRKKDTKQNYREGRGRGKSRIYDEKGILIGCKKDLCDCMDDTCPGCHFPCPKCRSNKCGHECRQNRKWIFDCVELDGVSGSVKENPYAKEFQTPIPSKK